MNKSKYINPKDCLKCGDCCKSFSIVYDGKIKEKDKLFFSEVDRFRTLNTKLIEIIELDNGDVEVKFNFSCKHLIEKEGYFACAIYKGNRPELCKCYPYKNTTNCKYKKKEGISPPKAKAMGIRNAKII